MAVIDKSFNNLLNKILSDGFRYEDPNRKGTYRIQIPSYKFEHQFINGFPAITTKKLYWKGIVTELLWFLRGDTDTKFLIDNNVNIWNKDGVNYLNRSEGANYTEEEYTRMVKEEGLESGLGRVYGFQMRSYGKERESDYQPIPKIISGLKLKPNFNFENNKHDLVGKIFNSNNSGKFYVIKEFKTPFSKGVRFNIHFKETGYVRKNVTKQNILSGEVLDIFSKTNQGVGCLGDVDKNSELYKLFKPTWDGMLSRCYNKNNSDYKYYGAKGVFVCNRWLIFKNFIEDITSLKNYNKKILNWKEYTLDKDVLGYGYYSKETCIFADKKQQVEYREVNGYVSKIQTLNNGVDQIQNLINQLISSPMSTRHVVSYWNPNDLIDCALPPCHWSFEILVEPVRVNPLKFRKPNSQFATVKSLQLAIAPEYQFTLKWHQRSVDTFLGLPFNIASYALLAQIIARLTGMRAKGIEGDLSNVHIYEPHMNAVKEQLKVDPNKFNEKVGLEEFDGFKMGMHNNIDQWLNSKEIDDFKLKNYSSHKTIKAEMIPYDS